MFFTLRKPPFYVGEMVDTCKAFADELQHITSILLS